MLLVTDPTLSTPYQDHDEDEDTIRGGDGDENHAAFLTRCALAKAPAFRTGQVGELERLRYVMDLTDRGGRTRSVHDDITAIVIEFEYGADWPVPHMYTYIHFLFF